MIFQFTIGNVFAVGRIIAFPDQCCLVSSLGEVSVNAIVGYIELASGEPFGITLAEIIADNGVPRVIPIQKFISHFCPEGFRIIQ